MSLQFWIKPAINLAIFLIPDRSLGFLCFLGALANKAPLLAVKGGGGGGGYC